MCPRDVLHVALYCLLCMCCLIAYRVLFGLLLCAMMCCVIILSVLKNGLHAEKNITI